MQQKVSIATDETSHQGNPASRVKNFSHIVPSLICMEACVPMRHVASLNGPIGKHSLATQVLHKGHPIAQQFHDCGYLITHMSPLGDHAIGPLQSSRVVIFGAGMVKIEGQAVGFAIFDDPSTPMLTCGTYPLPVGASHDSTLNSVVVGMDPEWDHQCGWDHIVMLILRAGAGQLKDGIELVAAFFSGGAAPAAKIGRKVAGDAVEGVLKGFAGQALSDALGTPDIGRQYQESMQRRRAAGDDFDSARRAELARGGVQGAGEVIAGPLASPLFGTGSQEPEL